MASELCTGILAILEIFEECNHNRLYLNIAEEEKWIEKALDTEIRSSYPTEAESIDFLFFVHDRHHGNKASAKRYLEWETGLLNQVGEQEVGRFQLTQVDSINSN